MSDKEHKLNWRFEASIDDNESIILKTTQDAFHHKGAPQIHLDILNTKEKLIRESLIKLGWTPPKEKP
jgi:hypothetical protein